MQSRTRLLIALLLLTLAAPSQAEDEPPKKADGPTPAAKASFPESWIGSWTGRCELIRGGRTAMTFPMELHVEPTKDGHHTWRIVYGEGAKRQVRPYELLPVEGQADQWRIDEKNGIVLDAYFENDRLRNRFAVGQSVIETTYARQGDELTVTLTTFGGTPTKTTGGEKGIPPVASFPLRAVQHGVLRRSGR